MDTICKKLKAGIKKGQAVKSWEESHDIGSLGFAHVHGGLKCKRRAVEDEQYLVARRVFGMETLTGLLDVGREAKH